MIYSYSSVNLVHGVVDGACRSCCAHDLVAPCALILFYFVITLTIGVGRINALGPDRHSLLHVNIASVASTASHSAIDLTPLHAASSFGEFPCTRRCSTTLASVSNSVPQNPVATMVFIASLRNELSVTKALVNLPPTRASHSDVSSVLLLTDMVPTCLVHTLLCQPHHAPKKTST